MDTNETTLRGEIDLILEVLAKHPEGLSVGEIARGLARDYGVKLMPYAVKYRLRNVASDVVAPVGQGRGRRYRLLGDHQSPALAPQSVREPTHPVASPLDEVRRPLDARPYVGYDPEWLLDYEPGVTFYLPTDVRAHLATIGASPAAARAAGTFARDIYERLLIDLSWASSKLEGNTYSRLDTQNLLEFGQRAEGRDATEAQMILNHKAAIDLLVAEGTELRVSESLLRGLHAALSENLLADPRGEGQLRTREVRIGGSTYYPTAVPQLIAECFAQIAQKAAAISDPFEQAFFLMVHVPYLQPFIDVNKRTSRLAANIPLMANNLCPLTFVDVPERDYVEAVLAVYELKRIEPLRALFNQAYERSCALYVVAQAATTPPDPIRLRYRAELSRAIADAVRGGVAPSLTWGTAWADAHEIEAADKPLFAERLFALLLDLNDASASRHGLRPSEFVAWRAKFAAVR
jgi:fido (protein-threonine AMPylation protein)